MFSNRRFSAGGGLPARPVETAFHSERQLASMSGGAPALLINDHIGGRFIPELATGDLLSQDFNRSGIGGGAYSQLARGFSNTPSFHSASSSGLHSSAAMAHHHPATHGSLRAPSPAMHRGPSPSLRPHSPLPPHLSHVGHSHHPHHSHGSAGDRVFSSMGGPIPNPAIITHGLVGGRFSEELASGVLLADDYSKHGFSRTSAHSGGYSCFPELDQAPPRAPSSLSNRAYGVVGGGVRGARGFSV